MLSPFFVRLLVALICSTIAATPVLLLPIDISSLFQHKADIFWLFCTVPLVPLLTMWHHFILEKYQRIASLCTVLLTYAGTVGYVVFDYNLREGLDTLLTIMFVAPQCVVLALLVTIYAVIDAKRFRKTA